MILGLYMPAEGFGHDSAVALVDDEGTIIAAQSEERFSRIKMDGGFPFRAWDALVKTTGVAPRDLRAVALPFLSPAGKAQEGARLLARSLARPGLAAQQVRNRLRGDAFQQGMEAIGAYRYREQYREELAVVRAHDNRPRVADWRGFLAHCGLDATPLVRLDHQMAHAAGAWRTSGWDNALVITADGLGALKSGIVAEARGGDLRMRARTFYPNSAGGFWETITAICGFHHMKHGGKITGLAAHGDPNAPCAGVMRAALWNDGLSLRTALDPVAMKEALAGTPREDIAATAQRRLEDVITTLVRNALRRTGQRRVALSGGVFGNVRLNQAIAELDGVDEVFIYPAMGDEGLALGAALWTAGRRAGARPSRLAHLYVGPEYSEPEMEASLRQAGLEYERLDEAALAARAARLLAAGEVVALFRGRMEYGPRALGHRTLLYQTTDPTVNDWLNKRLRRTEFMPFAPVTLDEEADRCYVGLASRRYAAQFMTITCQCTPWMREVSPAVVHLDGTARPQLISQAIEPFYYRILKEYDALTGIPSLINTSFNMHEEPIVCTPADAVRAYVQGHLDRLVLGPYLVSRPRPA